jgi:hypothetical protein
MSPVIPADETGVLERVRAVRPLVNWFAFASGHRLNAVSLPGPHLARIAWGSSGPEPAPLPLHRDDGGIADLIQTRHRPEDRCCRPSWTRCP